MISTVGRGGVCSPLSVIVAAMLLGIGVGSFVGCGVFCVVVVVVVGVNCRETVVVVNNMEDEVMLGVMEVVPMLIIEREEGHG